MMSMLGSRSYL